MFKKTLLATCIAITAIAPAFAQTAPVVGPNINLSQAPGNQYEPAVAINPADPTEMFIAARNETGGLAIAHSRDAGISWAHKIIAISPIPAAGDLPRAYGNVSLAWDSFGNLFITYLVQGSTRSASYVGLALSTDGGQNFKSPVSTAPVLLLPATNLPLAGDQPTVAVGPGSNGAPGSVWLTYFTQGGIAVSSAAVTGTGKVGAFTSQLLPSQPVGVNFGDIAVGPAGEAIVTYGPNSGGSGGTIYTQTDPDGLGAAPFNPPVQVAATNLGGFTNIPAQPNWGIDPEAGLAIDRTTGPHRGRVYLVYTDATAPGGPDTNIFVTTSDDLGVTWHNPVRVNDDATANSQFLPRIALDQSTGAVAVTWYDARNAPLNNTAQYAGSFSTDGGASFSANFLISAGTSNQANSIAAFKKADYGDYTGNAFANGRLVPAWADNSNSTGDNPNGATNFDVFTAIVNLPAAVPPAATLSLPAAPASGWFAASPVTGSFAASTSTSTIASLQCTGATLAAPTGIATTAANAAVLVTTPGANAVSCTATDAAGATSAASLATINIDSAIPALTPTITPAQPLLGAVVTAAANPAASLSGIASASCAPPDATMLGAKSLICTATNTAGTTGTASLTYVVGLALTNLAPPPAKPVRAGNTVTVSLQLADASATPITETLARSLGSCAVTATIGGAAPQCLTYRRATNEFSGRVTVPASLATGTYPIVLSAVLKITTLGTTTELVRVLTHR